MKTGAKRRTALFDLDPSVGNLDAFARAFTRRTNLPWKQIWPTIQRYYAEEYPLLKRFIPDAPGAAAVIGQCLADGWDIVLATQPLFPETEIGHDPGQHALLQTPSARRGRGLCARRPGSCAAS